MAKKNGKRSLIYRIFFKEPESIKKRKKKASQLDVNTDSTFYNTVDAIGEAEAPAAPVYDAPAPPVYDAPAPPVYDVPAPPVYETPAAPDTETPMEPVTESPIVGDSTEPKIKSRFCGNCGNEVAANENFCIKCGKSMS